MDKRQADKIIVEYTDKIYGFCLGKTGNIDKAQELAANVTLEVYSSLLKADEIGNVTHIFGAFHKMFMQDMLTVTEKAASRR